MTARHWWWVGLFVGLALLVLTIVAFSEGLEVADQLGGVVGGVFGVGSFSLSVVSALALRSSSGSGASGGGRPVVKATGPGSVAAGGDATGNATGAGSVVTGPAASASLHPPALYGPVADVEATDGGVAAGGNTRDNATRDNSRREIP
ncbi:hypothetical protein [Streptomyces sp. NBC_00046]|uniref:hypothetical protein n=1 Tax=unclassified Streptomyces TaxID=2593676 RepID=UPI0032555EB7